MATLTREQMVVLIKIANGAYSGPILISDFEVLFDPDIVDLWVFDNYPIRVLNGKGKALLAEYLCDIGSQTKERTE